MNKKIILELEIGVETGVVVAALESQAQLFDVQDMPEHVSTSMRMFRDISKRLKETVEQKVIGAASESFLTKVS